VPARNLFEVDLALSVIAAIGLDVLLAKSKAATRDFIAVVRLTLLGISILIGVAVFAAVMLRFVAEGWFARFFAIPDSIQLNHDYTFGTAKPAMIRNLSWNSPTLAMPLLFFILTIGILFLLVRMRLRTTAIIAIPVLIVADTFSAARGMYDNPSTELLYGSAGRPELAFLRSRQFDREHYRLFPVDFDLGSMTRLTSTYHLTTIYPYPLLNVFSSLPVINDYGPFWIKRYQAVTGFSAAGTMPVANLQNYKMLSFLGARYLMVLSPESRRSIEQARLDSAAGNAAPKAFSAVAVTSDSITIFENPSALPRFRFVRRITSARDLDDALSLMNQPEFNPAEEAIVEGIADDRQLQPSRILSEKLAATRLKWEMETSGRSFFVAGDSFFPGWTATVDGRTVPIYAVYGCVRGILLETAGRHHVEMRFVPPGLRAGLACTGVGLLLLGILWFGNRTGRMNRLPLEQIVRSARPRYKAGAV
jgi:hypothetical protein